jgi:transcriptional antiterminator RfaH
MSSVSGLVEPVRPAVSDRACAGIDDLLSGPGREGSQWWVVHTKSRMEKALAGDLELRGVHFYLPLVRAQRRYAGRRFQVSLPLFPGYLFLCGNEEDRYTTLMTHRAARVIPVVDQERFRNELRQVYRVTAAQEPVDLYPGLRSGRRCRILYGSLQGVEGVVIRRRDVCRVYLGIEALGQSAELEIDAAMLEVID